MTQVNLQQLKASFAELYGAQIKGIITHKANRIYFIRCTEATRVIKIFDREESLHWQVKCLRQLEERNTAGIVPYCKNLHHQYVNYIPNSPYMYGVLPFIPGKPMEPSSNREIKDCISLLAHFHNKGKGIYGLEQKIPSHSSWYEKLEKRSDLFAQSIQSHEFVLQVDGLLAYVQKFADDVSLWAKWVIDHFPHSHMLFLEEQAQLERQIAHLDVAPHNFRVQENGSYFLLDFDLVKYSPVVIDISQFIHRALMYYQWSMDLVMDLLAEYQRQRILHKVEIRMILLLLIYPHDIYREWLGVWKQQSGFPVKKVIDLFQQIEGMWMFRRKFVRACQAMLK